jgi:hypothetical protein
MESIAAVFTSRRRIVFLGNFGMKAARKEEEAESQ